MKYPRSRRMYCNKCKQHSDFTITMYKKGRESILSQGTRRYKRKQKGYGGQVKPRQRKTAKTTKKQILMARCQTCGYESQTLKKRLRKLTISA
jgi:large subunit ribosomal protein L44e